MSEDIDKPVHQNPAAREGFENLYHKMVEEVQDYAIILLDKEGIIQNWNKGAQNIKKYSAAEAVGMHFQMFYLPQDRASKLPARLLQEAEINGRAIHEGWRLRKDQTRFWGSITLTALHNDEGDVIAFSKVTRDLTERKIADDQLRLFAQQQLTSNEELRKSEERYHKMISEIQDYAIILLNENGDIQNWNAGAEKIKGYSANEIVGKNFRIFYLPKDQAELLPEKLIGVAIANGKATHEGLRVRKDGTTFWGSIVMTALHADDGSIIGFSKVTRDLTERKLAEDNAHRYLLDLQTQNKHLEQFAYATTHDLQEPLRKIRSFTDLINISFQDEESVKKYLNKISITADRMSELIKSVLNYSGLGVKNEQMIDTDMNVILQNVLNDLELIIQQKNAKVLSDHLPVINAIPLQISQLFTNLLSNALKFSQGEPLIQISISSISKEQIVHAPSVVFHDHFLEIAFKDNGIGFEKEYEEQIFSLFQRLHGKHEFPGSGIGLALCKKIMENHQGYISAIGTPGKGASFYLYFPVDPVD